MMAPAHHATAELHAQVLNRIIDFADMSGAQLFTADMVDDLLGFQGNYSREFEENVTKGLDMLREYFRKPQEDLKELVDTFWPEDNFRIEPES